MESLCEQCRQCDVPRRVHMSTDYSIQLGTVNSMLRKQDQCALCAFVVKIVSCKYDDDQIMAHEHRTCEIFGSTSSEAPIRQASVEVRLVPEPDMIIEDQPKFSTMFETVKIPGARDPTIVRSIPTDLLNANLLRQWHSLCATIHGNRCSDPKWLHINEVRAMRVIDVHTRTIVWAPEGCVYAALSYVWGDGLSTDHLSTSADLAVLPAPLKPSHRVPRTIEDAIHVTQQIGLRYLWVDALCIVQQPFENEDKTQQLAQMDTIFKTAEIVIAALSAKDAKAGLFDKRQFLRQDNILRLEGVELRVGTHEIFDNYLCRTMWAKRAWVFQEGVLARRILYIGQYESHWTCQCVQWRESLSLEPDPDGDREALLTALPDTSRPPNWVLNFERIYIWQDEVIDTSNSWRAYQELVQRYAVRKLGRPSDGVNAVLGILKMIQRFDQELSGTDRWATMYHGLPAVVFDIAFLWQAMMILKRGTDPEGHQIPSWSWAGWLGRTSSGVNWDDSLVSDYDQIAILPAVKWFLLRQDGRSVAMESISKSANEWSYLHDAVPYGLDLSYDANTPPLKDNLIIAKTDYYLHFLTTSITCNVGHVLAHQDPYDEEMPRKSFEPLFPVPYALLDTEGRFVGSIRLAPEDAVTVRQTARPLECIFVSYSDERGWAYYVPEQEAVETAARYPGEGWPEISGCHQYINAICIRRQRDGTAVRSSTAIVKFSREGWLRCKPKTEWIVLG